MKNKGKTDLQLKVKQVLELKKLYDFEAPIFSASVTAKDSGQSDAEIIPLDLITLLAPNLENTYLVRVNGESMIDENIFDGDILIVEKSYIPKDGQIVIASLNGELTVKTFRVVEGKVYLYSANKKFLPLEIKPFWEFEIQGIVKHVIHSV